MKTRIIITLAIIALNINLVTARNAKVSLPEGPSVSDRVFSLESLFPSTPKEATFDEEMEFSETIPDITILAPVTPREASFSEAGPTQETVNPLSPPVSPREATFEDEISDLHYFHAPCDVRYGCSM
jgi:hypothetical protein